MSSFLTFAVLLLLAATHATSAVRLTSLANLTLGSTVRIVDNRNFQFTVDPGYPGAPEFTPVNAAAAMPTTTMTPQDWVLIPQNSTAFMIQSAIFPSMFISYASFGIAATNQIHSQLVLRGTANAAVFSLQTLSGGTTVKYLNRGFLPFGLPWLITLPL
ncbi:hypothetical protein B0H16DRAFT_1805652 [Mycena metata]|uniref:Uncharacterized protein n=1 Tax=Mycena metata TaxID=1033252 RepID=A0AAD7JGK5_9AGAR|nr:hypothetical protein B0H16DRAFT_1805652 [Mycena metata]